MAKENSRLFREIKEKIVECAGNELEVKDHFNVLARLKEHSERNSRHVNSFQADLVISDKTLAEKPVELVIIEVKGAEFINTHDVLIYSSKARRHKVLFPWLRYGMVWSSPPDKEKGVPMRFLMNNESLDFAYNFENQVGEKFDDFYRHILWKQIDASRRLYELYNNSKNMIEYFNVVVDLGTGLDKKEDR
ncbi:MAG: hypothetical protein ACP5UO_06460 [Thermoplasmata archaeon]